MTEASLFMGLASPLVPSGCSRFANYKLFAPLNPGPNVNGFLNDPAYRRYEILFYPCPNDVVGWANVIQDFDKQYVQPNQKSLVAYRESVSSVTLTGVVEGLLASFLTAGIHHFALNKNKKDWPSVLEDTLKSALIGGALSGSTTLFCALHANVSQGRLGIVLSQAHWIIPLAFALWRSFVEVVVKQECSVKQSITKITRFTLNLLVSSLTSQVFTAVGGNFLLSPETSRFNRRLILVAIGSVGSIVGEHLATYISNNL